MGAKNSKELAAELAAARAKRKPAPTDAELAEAAEVQRLEAELAAEYRALRLEDNDAIRAKYCPNASFSFVDFDPDNAHPPTMEHNGHTCTVHTRFVVRAADGDTVRRMQNDALPGQPQRDTYDKLKEVVEACIVYPEPVKGPGSAQHYLDLQASFARLGGIVTNLAAEALRLGGVAVAAHQAKS